MKNDYRRLLGGKATLHYVEKAGHVVQSERQCANKKKKKKKSLPLCMQIDGKQNQGDLIPSINCCLNGIKWSSASKSMVYNWFG